jgi:hypothetical protein
VRLRIGGERLRRASASTVPRTPRRAVRRAIQSLISFMRDTSLRKATTVVGEWFPDRCFMAPFSPYTLSILHKISNSLQPIFASQPRSRASSRWPAAGFFTRWKSRELAHAGALQSWGRFHLTAQMESIALSAVSPIAVLASKSKARTAFPRDSSWSSIR